MNAYKQRIRVAAARKKKEVKLAKGAEEGTSSALRSSVRFQKGNLTEMTIVRKKGLPLLLVMPLQRGSHLLSQAMVWARG